MYIIPFIGKNIVVRRGDNMFKIIADVDDKCRLSIVGSVVWSVVERG
jgi:hypothetical protein